jgi:hypothetical protein
VIKKNKDRPKTTGEIEVFIQDCHGKSCIQQEEESFYQPTGLKFEEETSEMLHLEHGFVWC